MMYSKPKKQLRSPKFRIDTVAAGHERFIMMNQMSMNPDDLPTKNKIMTLQDFQDLHSSTISTPMPHQEIGLLIGRLLKVHGIWRNQCILLPSLMAMADFFNVSYTDIQKAFRWLRLQGFDYMIPGCFGHISVWPHSV